MTERKIIKANSIQSDSEIYQDPLISSVATAKAIDDMSTFKKMTVNATDLDEINIFVLSDLHAGEEAHNTEKVVHTLDKIKKLDNAKIVCLGDLCDNSTKNSVGDPNSSTMNPLKQQRYIIKLLKQKGILEKIIAIIGGNHDGQTGSRNIDSNSSLTLLIATSLGKFEKATDFDAFMSIIMRAPSFLPEQTKIILNVFARHNNGKNGAPWGGALDKTSKNQDLCSAILYLTGHHHANEFGTSMHMIEYNGRLVEVPVYFYTSNSYLENAHYATAQGFPPSNNEASIINVKIVPNISYILANKQKRKQLLPFAFAVSQIFIDSPEYDMLIEKQEKLKRLSRKERKQEEKKEFTQCIDKIFAQHLSKLSDTDILTLYKNREPKTNQANKQKTQSQPQNKTHNLQVQTHNIKKTENKSVNKIQGKPIKNKEQNKEGELCHI